ncbi:MAG: SAM-dependent methyltransferase, partial [Lachnospiraceae bacterium]|nr:SAM-dependent methyltransferase [Lachnospiraceae bacterium]
LRELGDNSTGRVQEIYQGARSNIEEPANLKKIITNIDELDWYSAKEEGLGNLYEGLLEKNANEKKSGAGQYFTPRVLIDVMTELIAPQPGEKCNDPACGTFGFMIAADCYVKNHTNDWMDLTEKEAEFELKEAFTGAELVHETHRLALMNAMLHDIEGKIYLCDTLSNQGKVMNGFDVVLTNPPFGTKKGGERANRDDFTYQTSNKQLNFLQHIYRSLKADGKARAAVVLPDNVLFADGEGERIRADLMNKCNLHTVLRLPTGIFYAQGVKTNVLFFTRGTSDQNNTDEVWFYDLRTNMPSFGKTNPLKYEHFRDFITAYTAEDRHAIKDERWNVFMREELGNTLDKGLIRDDSVLDYEDLPDPIESGEECIAQLEEAIDLMMSVVKELKALESSEV